MVMQVVVVMREFLLNAYDNLICASTNWLKTEISEWTMTPISSVMSTVFYVPVAGIIYDRGVTSALEVCLVLYLKSDVSIK